MKLIKLKANKGFTLVETFVVISITLVLSALAVAYNRSGERQVILYKDQAVVVGLLNRAKSLAIQKHHDPSIPEYLACAFGLHFESDSRDVILFRDLGRGSCVYNPDNANYAYNEPRRAGDPSEALETFSLDPRLEFEGIPEEGLDVFFIPPEVNVSSTIGLPVTIVIKTTDGALRATTTVSIGGQIVTQ